MSAISDQFDKDIEQIEADDPVTFRFNGESLTGMSGESLDSQVMRDAGYLDSRRRPLVARKKSFEDKGIPLPKENDPIEIGNVEYRVESVETVDGVVYQFALVQLN